MSAPQTVDLILASGSRYRRELLARLGKPYRSISPDIDETPLPGEHPVALAARLAREKARAVADDTTDTVVIGSDQVAELDGIALGKPGDAPTARRQLGACAGRAVAFHTALCVLDTRDGSDRRYEHIDRTTVVFRPIDAGEIARYVDREQPFDCAGSFRCEELGIALFERIETSDPTALIGLPLIALARLLREAGLDVI
jgi:septum formation protein